MRGRFFVDYLELSSNQHLATLFFRPFSCLEDIVILNTIEEFRCVSQDQNNSSQMRKWVKVMIWQQIHLLKYTYIKLVYR